MAGTRFDRKRHNINYLRTSSSWLSVAVLFALCLTPHLSRGAVWTPSNHPVQLNEVNGYFLTAPSVASNRLDQTVYVWHGPGASDDRGVFAALETDHTEFRVNVTTSGIQEWPGVAFLNDGQSFVVVWCDESGQVLLRHFRKDGIPLTGEVALQNPSNGDSFEYAVVRTLPSSKLVVGWVRSSGGRTTVEAQGFLPDGQSSSDLVTLSTSSRAQRELDAEVASDGSVAFVWTQDEAGPVGRDVYFASLAPDLSLIRSEWYVAGAPEASTNHPDLAWSHDDRFVLTWVEWNVVTRVVDLLGFQHGNSYSYSGEYGLPAVDRSSNGRFFLIWTFIDEDDTRGLRSVALGSDGGPIDIPTVLETGTHHAGIDIAFGEDDHPKVAYNGAPDLTVEYDIYAIDYELAAAGLPGEGPGGVEPNGGGGLGGSAGSDHSNPLGVLVTPSAFTSETTFHYDLPRDDFTQTTTVRLELFDTSGCRIRTLTDPHARPSSRHELRWDGGDENGAQVPRGTYFYRITAGDLQQSGKVVRVG